MPKQSEKRKRVSSSVMQKREVIKKLEKGASGAIVCEQHGVKKQTVSYQKEERRVNEVRSCVLP